MIPPRPLLLSGADVVIGDVDNTRFAGREDITPKAGKVPESRIAWFGLTVGAWNYTTRVPDASFPNWRQVIPDYSNEPKVQRCCFTDKDVTALQKILPTFPDHDSTNETIVVSGQGSRLSISGRGEDAASDTVLMLDGGSSYEGPDGQVGLNRSYLLEALAAGFRNFSYAGDMSPLKSVDDKGGTHIMMPVRIGPESTPPVPKTAPIVPEKPVTTTETKKETVMPEKNELSALDKLQATFEVAKQKLRGGNQGQAPAV
jgi:hypothetical protein